MILATRPAFLVALTLAFFFCYSCSNSAPQTDSSAATFTSTQALNLKSGLSAITTEVVLSDGPAKLTMHPYSIRGENFQALQLNSDQSHQTIATTAPLTYRGAIDGQPGSQILATIANGHLSAVMQTEEGATYAISPKTGADHLIERQDGLWPELRSKNNLASKTTFTVAEVAIEVEPLFLMRRNNSFDEAILYIENALNIVNFIYQREFGIHFFVTGYMFWVGGGLPYSSGHVGDITQQMGHHWNTRPELIGFPRDFVYLVSGMTLNDGKLGGTQNPHGSICDPALAYGVVTPGGASIGTPAEFNALVGILIHEMGHMWGAEHCNWQACGVMAGPENYNGAYNFDSFSINTISFNRDTKGCFHEIPATVTPNSPDLVVENLGGPAEITAGQSYNMSGDVVNRGNSPAVGNVRIRSWLTIDGNPFNGNGDDIELGGPTGFPMMGIDLNLGPQGRQPFGSPSLVIPSTASLGGQTLVTCVDTGAPPCAAVCETNENNNCGSRPVTVRGTDAAITSLIAPTSVYGVQPVVIQATVRNNSITAQTFPVRAVFGFNNFRDVLVSNIQPAEQRLIEIPMTSPFAFEDCGLPETIDVTVCSQMNPDSDINNNCMRQGVQVIDPHWDLQVEISYAPQTVALGGYHAWDLRITNIGSRPSDPRQIFSSICHSTFGCVNTYRTFDIGSLTPFQPLNLYVTNFWVPTSALLGWQQIYATVNFNQDYCNPNGNNDDARDVFITQ